MTSLPAVRGAHLVGSINQPTARDTLRVVADNLGGHVARIPDGEVGERFHWILFQGAAFDAVKGLQRVPVEPIIAAGFDVRPLALDGSVPAAELNFGPLGYAGAALASYVDFVALRDAGAIPAGTRFQVCLPTPIAPMSVYTTPAEHPDIYPAYAAAIRREIVQIVAGIPADDLAIQLDLATEFSYIEQVGVRGRKPFPWFVEGAAEAAQVPTADIIDAITALAADVAATVPDAVQLGFHLCYGDVAEKHFVEPADAANLVAVANALCAKVSRPIEFLHLPVPIERDDAAYFAPLGGLSLHPETLLFLGLVHHEDGTEGAARRIAAARPALAGAGLAEFGIATECGFGRGPADRTAPLLRLHADVIEAANA
jgi:methionine synthase II (cobalamin-independent)